MAKYVEYTPDVPSQPDGPTNVYWFPSTFSQSQLGDRIIGSNACTLIAVLLAGRIHDFKMTIWGYSDQPLSRMLVTSLAEAIVEGNEIHEALMLQQNNNNNYNNQLQLDLTVPEALEAVHNHAKYETLVEWTDHTTVMLETMKPKPLSLVLIEAITDFETKNPPADKTPNSSLFAVLVTRGRSVLWVYQPETAKITVIDSHAHLKWLSGAVVAQSRVGDVENLCGWFCKLFEDILGAGEQVPWEVAWLYVKRDE